MNKDLLRNGDAISAAVLAALGVHIFLESREWAYVSDEGPGPAFFPAWYGIAMVALSLALLVQTVRSNAPPGDVDWQGVGRALTTWAAFAVSAALMGWLGFIVCFAGLMFFMIAVVFRQPVLTAGIAAVCAAAGFYVVFPLALSVPLPVGVLGF